MDVSVSVSLFQDELASTIEHTVKAALHTVLCAITKAVGSKFTEFRVEMAGKEKENESLKLRLEISESELKAVRGCINAADADIKQPLIFQVTYEKARKKLRRATETSDLNTTDDEQTRKRKPSAKLSFLEDEEDFSISKNVRSSQRMPLLPTPPLFPTTVASPSSSSSKNTSNSEDGNISSDDRNYNSNTSSNDTGTGNRDKSSYVPLSDRDRMIFTILEEIKGQGRQNTLMLQALLKQQPHVEQEHGSLRLDEFRFPLDTKEDIDRVERMLMDQATEKALITHICSLGGTTADDIIRRMMSHVLTNNLARGYNWLGRGNKSPFSVLALARVIKAAAKKSSVTEADTEARMRSWLKYRGDRDGEQKGRAEKKKDAESANAATIAAASAASDIEED